jgi:hypothetical protein
VALTVVGNPTGAVVHGATTIATVFPTGYTVVAEDLDVLIVLSKNRTEATVPATPANYTLVGTGLGGVTGAAVDAGRIRLTVFTRVLAAGNTAPTVGNGGGNATGPVLSGWHYILRKDAAGTYDVILTVLSQATSTLSWSQPTGSVPVWAAGDHLLMPSGATTDAVAGFTPGTVAGTGLTVGSYTEDIDVLTTQGDDARMTCTRTTVTTGPTSVVTRAITLTTTASTGAMGLIRVRHIPASVGATVTPAAVGASATVGVPVVSVPAGTSAFTVGASLAGSVHVLGFGATTQLWTTLLPTTVTATATFGVPSLWGPPSGVQAVALAHNLVRVTWNPVLAADGYRVERNGTLIADFVAGTQYDDSGVVEETAYDYRVEAYR